MCGFNQARSISGAGGFISLYSGLVCVCDNEFWMSKLLIVPLFVLLFCFM